MSSVVITSVLPAKVFCQRDAWSPASRVAPSGSAAPFGTARRSGSSRRQRVSRSASRRARAWRDSDENWTARQPELARCSTIVLRCVTLRFSGSFAGFAAFARTITGSRRSVTRGRVVANVGHYPRAGRARTGWPRGVRPASAAVALDPPAQRSRLPLKPPRRPEHLLVRRRRPVPAPLTAERVTSPPFWPHEALAATSAPVR